MAYQTQRQPRQRTGHARRHADGVSPLFADRDDAGIRLGRHLGAVAWTDPVVLGLARGGVVVAARVAEALDVKLDVVVARKISAPGRREFGVGAVTADGPARYDQATLRVLGWTPEGLRADSERERAEAIRRIEHYRSVADPLPVADRDVLLVDDGLATGVTARAAVAQLRAAGPRRLVFAAPVGAQVGMACLRADRDADEVVCLAAPNPFGSVSRWYREFRQTSDDEVLGTLRGSWGDERRGRPAGR